MDYNYSNSINSSTNGNMASLSVALFLMFFLYFAILIAAYVFIAVCTGKIFKKAGVPFWQAWVPFLNGWRMLELGGQQGFWAVLAIIPVVNIVSIIFMFIAMYHIGKKLDKGDAFILLAILLPIVWYPWLAFDHSTWDESKGAPRLDNFTAPTSPTAPMPPVATPTTPAPEQPTDQDQTPPTAPSL